MPPRVYYEFPTEVKFLIDSFTTVNPRGGPLVKPEVVVLGSVGVRCGRELHRPSSGLSRALLALLAEAGQHGVAEDRLQEVVWGVRVSASTVTVAIHRLRRWLQTVTTNAIDVHRTATGYALTPADVPTDIALFRGLVTESTSLPPRARAAKLGQAMALWHGPAMADVPPDRTDPVVSARMARELRTATMSHGEALLEAGDPTAAARALETVAERHPFDESLHAVLIEAFARTGRQTEAITAFHSIRVRLREEFGVSPGQELNDAMTRALHTTDEGPPRPAQLPLDVTGFTGRVKELATLTAAANTHRAVVVVGMGGVGKTDLTVHWAHRHQTQFPDGQLYADLRGYATEAPVRPIDVLRRFLRALGSPDDNIPADAASSLYRSLLRDKRILVVLDNAADADQVRPLLPGAPDCLALITGRAGLDGLAAVNGAARLKLDVLQEADAMELLRGAVGETYVDAEPDATRALARACCFLPLALRVAALRLTLSGTKSIAAYTTRLERNGKLAELVIDGDPLANIGAVFEHSYRRLPVITQRLFQLLGEIPGGVFTTEKTAALAGLAPAVAQREMDRLVAAQLLTARSAGQYTLLELVRELAHQHALNSRRPMAV